MELHRINPVLLAAAMKRADQFITTGIEGEADVGAILQADAEREGYSKIVAAIYNKAVEEAVAGIGRALQE